MPRRKRNFGCSFVSFIMLIINLTFMGAAHAQLTIIGSNQMSVSGSQTLTATGGSGGYTWTLAGGGQITGNCDTYTCTGPSLNYKAPDSNPNCNNNAKVCVVDSGGQEACLQIAINAYTSGERSELAYIAQPRCDPTCGTSIGACYGSAYWRAYGYKCDGSLYQAQELYLHLYPTELCGYCSHDGMGDCSAANCGCGCGPTSGWCESNTCTPKLDRRTEAMKAAGCCPPGLSGDATASAPPTNNTGNSCSITIPSNSSNNLKSGNLYDSLDFGILSLSYNSIDTNSGTLGRKWTHRFNEKLTLSGDNATIALRSDDGNNINFRLSGGVYYPDAISGDTSSIVKNSNGSYTRTTRDKTFYTYYSTGQLYSIVDKNGRTTLLAYSGGYLSSVTDPNG